MQQLALYFQFIIKCGAKTDKFTLIYPYRGKPY